MTATQAPVQLETPSVARRGYPASTARFDLMMAALSALFLGGLWLDGWAHFHGKVDDSFFTPWHFVFYGAFALSAAALAMKQWRGVSGGYAFGRALPKGYAASLAGVVLFGLGGVGDMVWHTLFGIEGGTEALLSPTHIMLGIGMALVFTGPVRSGWARAKAGEVLMGWRGLAPVLIGVTLLTALIMFFTSYAHPLANPLAHVRSSSNDMRQDFGVTAILLEAVVLSAAVGVLTLKWRLPFGAITLVAGVSGALLTVLVDSYPFVPPLAVALLVIEIAAYLLKPSAQRPTAFITVMTLLPALVYLAYFLTFNMAGERVYWSIHVWTGSIVLAGVVGALTGYALLAVSGTAEEER